MRVEYDYISRTARLLLDQVCEVGVEPIARQHRAERVGGLSLLPVGGRADLHHLEIVMHRA